MRGGLAAVRGVTTAVRGNWAGVARGRAGISGGRSRGGLPDVEGGEAFEGFGLDGYVVDGGQAGAGVGPVD